MIRKLAFRNVKRMTKDYLVYFITMAVVSALMFSFNTLLFSKEIQNLFEMAGTMAIMTGLATFFIVLIVAWLINYMVHFILEKRSREFGIYLLAGMKKKEIAGLYLFENLLLGTGAFFVGMLLGFFLQQILLSIFYSMIQMNYHLHLEFSWNCIVMTAASYGGCYLLALLRCRKKFKKMNIRDLMDSQKENESISAKNENRKKIFFPLSVIFIILFGFFLFCYKEWDIGIAILFLFGLVITIYLFYVGISAWISCYVRKKGNAVYCGNTLLLLRQLSAKVRTLSFTMGTLTALFTLALLGSSAALMFNHFQNQILINKFPFDVQVYSSQTDEDFCKEIEVLSRETKINSVYCYNIYENGTNTVNTYLYTHLKEFGTNYQRTDGTPNQKKIDQNNAMVYYDYDTYMAVSDYNYLRKMLKLPQINLKDNEYMFHMKDRVFRQTGDFSDQICIENEGERLRCAGYYTESFSQDGHNGSDYILVVPDSIAQKMRPYYKEMVSDIKGKTPVNLQKKLDDIETGDENICSGSDSIVLFAAKNLVRDNLVPEVKYMLSSIIFPLFYIGLVFLCVSLTVLSVQQLCDSVKYKYRYRILFQIGYSRKEIEKIILQQLVSYYLCPVLMAFVISGMISIYMGARFNFYTGVYTSPLLYFLISASLFLGVYVIYFIITYIGFKQNIEQGYMAR
ncbi:ABC transporter permease [Parablautia sp. Marseille-Q6255]|uniref:ABC transporter permease n=1 Tax=Parablautia sp. Marseille-Q6255 TaxID=3039593 RepID=UPI0024BD2F81|nr:ABC transporter permease [Parablautia sp. Marseille-Q6255]